MANQENLLTLIKNTAGHPFSFLRIQDDNSIINFEGKTKVVYGDTAHLEELGRELVAQTVLGEQKCRYKTEHRHGDNRSDLINHAVSGHPLVIVEVKEVSVDTKLPQLDKAVEQAFVQIVSLYLGDKQRDVFCSVAVVDVEHLVKNPTGIRLFLDEQPELSRKERLELFAKRGIYFETRLFVCSAKSFDPGFVTFDAPRTCVFEWREDAILRTRYTVCSGRNAVQLPTSSGAYGIKNIRNIKNPYLEIAKRNLLVSILRTVAAGYKAQRADMIYLRGKPKDFLIHTRKFILESLGDSFSLTTAQGAVIDGQNSIDCLKWITRVLISLGDKYDEDDVLHRIVQQELKSQGLATQQDFEGLRDFINTKVFVEVKITITEDLSEAKQIAIAKNTAIPVEKRELAIADRTRQTTVLSHAMLEKFGFLIKYPKMDDMGISQSMIADGLDVDVFLNFFKVRAMAIAQPKDRFSKIFEAGKVAWARNGENLGELDNFVTCEDADTESPNLALINAEMERLDAEKKKYQAMSVNAELAPPLREYASQEYDRACDEYKSREEELVEAKGNIQARWLPQNMDLAKKLFKSIIHTREAVQDALGKLTNEERDKVSSMIVKSQLLHAYSFFIACSMEKDVSNKLAKHVAERLVANLLGVVETYIVNMTELRNPSDAADRKARPVARKDGKTDTVEDVLTAMFDIPEL